MYNDKSGQFDMGSRRVMNPSRAPYGRSCPTFAASDGTRQQTPRVDDRIGDRLCDGSMPGQDSANRGTERDRDGRGWGLNEYPLAMVYSPNQVWRNLYPTEKALERGTLFAELDLPLEGDGRKGGL